MVGPQNTCYYLIAATRSVPIIWCVCCQSSQPDETKWSVFGVSHSISFIGLHLESFGHFAVNRRLDFVPDFFHFSSYTASSVQTLHLSSSMWFTNEWRGQYVGQSHAHPCIVCLRVGLPSVWYPTDAASVNVFAYYTQKIQKQKSRASLRRKLCPNEWPIHSQQIHSSLMTIDDKHSKRYSIFTYYDVNACNTSMFLLMNLSHLDTLQVWDQNVCASGEEFIPLPRCDPLNATDISPEFLQ